MCKNCLISAVATFFLVYFLLTALNNPIWSVWAYSLIITILLFISVVSCPVLNKGGNWNCCAPPKGKTARKVVKKKR